MRGSASRRTSRPAATSPFPRRRTKTLFELTVAGGASEGAAVTGSITVVVLNEAGTHSTSAFIDDNATSHCGRQDPGEREWTRQTAPTLAAGNIAIGGFSAGVGASAVILVRNGTVDAAIHQNASVSGNGGSGLTVSATQVVKGNYIAVGGAGGDEGVAGSVVVDVMNDSTKAHIDGGVTIGGAGAAVSASDSTSILSIAGAVAAGGTAGVGAGVDVEVVTKDTEASIAGTATATVTGDVTVDSTRARVTYLDRRRRRFRRHGGGQRQRRRSVLAITTLAFIAAGATVNAGGSVRVAANEALSMNIIGGNISAAGTAAVGAAAAIPIVTKETHAFIGDGAHVTAGAASSVAVKTGALTFSTIDPRFDPSVPGVIEGDGSTLNIGDGATGLKEDERVST